MGKEGGNFYLNLCLTAFTKEEVISLIYNGNQTAKDGIDLYSHVASNIYCGYLFVQS